MALPLVGAGVKLLGIDITKQLGNIPVIGGLFKSGHTRYAPDGKSGPLFDTINKFMARAVAGELAVISEVDKERRTNKSHRPGWQQFWDTDLYRAPLSPAQRALMRQLDPTKTAVPALPAGPVQQIKPGSALDPNNTLTFGQPTATPLGIPVPPVVQQTADKVGAAVGVSSNVVLVVAAIAVTLLAVRAFRS